MAAVTTTALAPWAPSPPSVSVFFSRAWMLSIVFLQLMKRSKFSFTCARGREQAQPLSDARCVRG